MFTNPPSIERFNLLIKTDFPERCDSHFEVPVKINPRWTPYPNAPRLFLWGHRYNGNRVLLGKRSSSGTVTVLSHSEGDEADLYGDLEIQNLREAEGIRVVLPDTVDYGEEIRIAVQCQNERSPHGAWEDELLIQMPSRPLKPLKMKEEFREFGSAFKMVTGEALGILGGIAANPLLK